MVLRELDYDITVQSAGYTFGFKEWTVRGFRSFSTFTNAHLWAVGRSSRASFRKGWMRDCLGHRDTVFRALIARTALRYSAPKKNSPNATLDGQHRFCLHPRRRG